MTHHTGLDGMHFVFKERFLILIALFNLLLNKKSSLKLLFLVSVSASSFFTLVRRYLMSFSFFTAWHINEYCVLHM
ncbi:hypothetical protein SCB49_07517 [unidentified eubacterium SCB49]|nr:hypothetical protein SCB49_07517 [unidentified eubacterium SCB49]